MDLPAGWARVDADAARKLEAELRRETPLGHVLHGQAMHAIARCETSDDVLYRSESDTDAVFLIHLTWSVETDPEWPATTRYADMAVFLESESDGKGTG